MFSYFFISALMVDKTRKIVEQFVICLFRGDNIMPVLYYLPPSPPCRAVLMLGRIIGIDFDLRAINVLEGDNRKPEFVQVTLIYIYSLLSFLINILLFVYIYLL